MSLDSVDMVIAIEQRFGVVIPNDAAERMVSVGDVYRFLLANARLAAETTCRTASAFYRLRRVLVGEFGVGRESIRPAASVADLVPRDDRREIWSRLSSALGVPLPALERPAWFGQSLTLAWCAVAIGAVGVGFAQNWLLSAMLVFSAWLSTVLAFELSRGLASEIPAGLASVGGLVHAFRFAETSAAPAADRAWSRETLWLDLCDVVSEQAGVAACGLTPDTTFVYDLGID